MRPALLAALGVLILAAATGLAPADAAEAEADPEPSGRYFAFRTIDTGDPAEPAQTQRCREHFGAVQGVAAILELDANLFSFTTNSSTAVVEDETARWLGTGYMCVVTPGPTLAGGDVGSDVYVELDLTEAGRVSFDGHCGLAPSVAQPGAAFFSCRLSVLPDPGRGVVGGFISSNSINNSAGVPGNPTGSIWTAHIVRDSWPAEDAPLASGPVPGGTAGEHDGQRPTYVVARGHRVVDPEGSCTGTAVGLELRRVQPQLNTGVIPQEVGQRVGQLAVCPSEFGGLDELTTAGLRVTGPSGEFVSLMAQGRCHDLGQTGIGPHEQRICSFSVIPAPEQGVQGGLVTTLGLASRSAARVGPGGSPQVSVSLVPVAEPRLGSALSVLQHISADKD